MREPRTRYRNGEERIYAKILKILLNTETHQLAHLEEQEELYSKVRGTGSKSETNATTQVMIQRRDVIYTQKLLAAVRSCEPGVCRGEEPSPAEKATWERPVG